MGVSGFNGMIFYIAACQDASALLMNMAASKPIDVPAMLIGEFPEDYVCPTSLPAETASCVLNNDKASDLLVHAAEGKLVTNKNGLDIYQGKNEAVSILVGQQFLTKEVVYDCWDLLFSKTRRWQNDTNGNYQKRTDFVDRGFVAHVKDDSLGCNNGFAHTWYEYIPPKLRGTTEKVPLVFYFHGVNCVPLYGAEQSDWHDVADKENFIVVYPAPALFKAWNIFNDPSLPSDFEFVLALIEHMKTVHPIDETRIYATGFSMGGMMTHAITSVYPDIFAAGAPCNAYNMAYFKTPKDVLAGFLPSEYASKLADESCQKIMADKKRQEKDWRMPIFQNAGYVDATIALWPIDEQTADVRTQTINYWKEFNNIPSDNYYDGETLTGLAADVSYYEDENERYYHQKWQSNDENNPCLLEQVVAKRMPHAINPVQIEYAWNFLKKFARASDGSLIIQED